MAVKMMHWTDRFIPENILNMSNMGNEDLIHCRVFVCINLLTIFLCITHAILFSVINYITNGLFTIVVIMGVISSIFAFLVYCFFYKTGYLHAATMLFSTAFIVVVLICIGITGGPHSALMPLLISSPVIASVIGGRQEGIYNSLVVFLLAGVMVFLDSFQFPFLQILPAEDYNSFFLSAWVVTILLNLGCTTSYQYFSERVYGNKKVLK